MAKSVDYSHEQLLASAKSLSQAELRAVLRRFQIADRQWINGARLTLSVADLRHIYDKVAGLQRGQVAIKSWAESVLQAQSRDSMAPRHVFCFWYCGDARRKQLPDACRTGLESLVSMCQEAGWIVHLLRYQEFPVPEGLALEDAGQILPLSEFQALLKKGFAVAHLSDYIRIKRCWQSGGFVWDLDVLCLRPLPKVVFSAPAWGHVFASATAQAHRHGHAAQWKYWQVNFLRAPQDMLYLHTPACFPKGSPAAWQWVEWFEGRLKAARPLEDYRDSLRAVQEAMASYGLHDAVQDPVVFSPIPYWTRTSCLQKRESPHWDLAAIESRCIAVNKYWQSQRQSS